jgi:O-antigen/teichoic acid export membrane protein
MSQRSEPSRLAAELQPDGSPVPAVPAAGALAALVPRLERWAKVLSAYFSAQLLTQLLGLSAGLLLVRTMPVREFALYALALSVVTFFTFVSDLGSTSSLLYFFHRTRREAQEFPHYFAAVRSLRRAAFALGAAAVVVALPTAAAAKGFGGAEIALATAGVLLCVWYQIAASLAVLALRLADRYGISYRAEIAGGGLRLAAAAAMAITSRLYGWLAVLGNAVATAGVALLARRGAEPPAAAPPDLAPYRRKVLRYLLPQLPNAVYFSLQGPLAVWLSATFGSTRNIAEVGALARLGMLVGILSNLTGIVLLPRLARIADERLYRVRCAQFGGLLASMALALFAAALTFPHGFLALLGRQYAGLDRELLLVVGGSGLTVLGGYVVSVNLARSWNRWQGLAVLAEAAVLTALVTVLPLGTTRGVLTFNLLNSLAGLALQLAIMVVGFTRPRLVHWE